MGEIYDRYEIFGTRPEKWKLQLMKVFTSNQVTPKYGGTNKDWKPFPLK